MADIDNLPKLYIRGIIAPDDSLLGSEGKTVSASDVSNFLKENKETPEIVVEISSDGGYRAEGVEIYNLLKLSGKKVHTLTYKANSIATVIMLGNANGGQRLIVEHANFIVHFARIDPMDLGLDALTARDFEKIADDVARADRQIVDIYCSELGEEKRTEIIAAMAEEKDLGARGAVKLGFATGYYKKKKKLSEQDFTGVLITDHLATLIQNKMATEKEHESKLEKLIQNLSSFLAKAVGKIKNEITLKLDGGKQIYVVPADPAKPEDLVNGKAFEIDEAGLPTEVPLVDGDYTLEDGRTITVAAGVITTVGDAVDAEKLQAEKVELEQQNKELTEKVAALEKEKSDSIKALADAKIEMKKEFDSIQMAFNEFKKAVPGDKADKKDDVAHSVSDVSKMTTAQKVRHFSKLAAKQDSERKLILNS